MLREPAKSDRRLSLSLPMKNHTNLANFSVGQVLLLGVSTIGVSGSQVEERRTWLPPVPALTLQPPVQCLPSHRPRSVQVCSDYFI